jgi:ABC-type nickel/cobalt efflux system permease component RcnA
VFFLALALGLRHALEPDHLVAVSTLLADRGARRRGAVGLAWGAGHGVALLLLGGGVLLVETALSERTLALLEIGVAAMLMLLGVRSVRRAFVIDPAAPTLEHRHGGVVHEHRVPASLREGQGHVHLGGWAVRTRPFLVGVVHGVAGSGALVVLALTALDSPLGRLLYVVVFAFGAMVGMGLLEQVVCVTLGRGREVVRFGRALLFSTGTCSIALGASSGWALLNKLGLV